MSTFNMNDLSRLLAKEFNLSSLQGKLMTRYLFRELKQALVRGDQVRLHQFGTLEARQRAAGVAINPRTRQRSKVPARRVMKLTTSPFLRRQLNATESPETT